jgi:GNAT superfamily N-acetyltransferase
MSEVEVTVSCPVFDSFRVQQVAGMFDLPIGERSGETFRVEMPELGDEWKIGLIVGPSGSGKSTIARRMFGDRLYEGAEWPNDRAVVDGMGDRPIREITGMFTAVGFGSPPSWIKPYRVLSGGERFRCDLARAMLRAGDSGGVLAFDEFTSVVDRKVARIASAAIARGVKRGRIACRFVAVTCHYDVTEWLEPDWVVDMAASRFQRRCLQRPSIDLEIFSAKRSAWRVFARHHYLSGSLSRGCRCFVALWEGVPVAFCATISLIGAKNRWRISRIVTLPDYQGVGIGTAVTEAVADMHRAEGHRVNLTASHPAMIAHCRRSADWRAVAVRKTGSSSARRFSSNYRASCGRAVVSFEYLGRRTRPRAR